MNQSEAPVSKYEWGPVWQEDVASAQGNFRVRSEARQNDTWYVEASAGNASAFKGMVTKLGKQLQELTGESHLVTVLEPMQCSLLLTPTGSLRLSYFRNKVADMDAIIHGGDLMGMALLVGPPDRNGSKDAVKQLVQGLKARWNSKVSTSGVRTYPIGRMTTGEQLMVDRHSYKVATRNPILAQLMIQQAERAWGNQS
jgi:hypothetical protein